MYLCLEGTSRPTCSFCLLQSSKPNKSMMSGGQPHQPYIVVQYWPLKQIPNKEKCPCPYLGHQMTYREAGVEATWPCANDHTVSDCFGASASGIGHSHEFPIQSTTTQWEFKSLCAVSPLSGEGTDVQGRLMCNGRATYGKTSVSETPSFLLTVYVHRWTGYYKLSLVPLFHNLCIMSKTTLEIYNSSRTYLKLWYPTGKDWRVIDIFFNYLAWRMEKLKKKKISNKTCHGHKETSWW